VSTPGATPIHLTILRQGDLNIVDLAETGVLIPRSETQVDDAFLEELAAEMERAAGAWGRGAAARRDLERVGGLVYSHLLTEPARRRLRDASETDLYLRLDERLIHVPWELCHDGQDFLVTKLRIGRQVITTRPIPEPRPAGRPSDDLRVLLVADPTESLPRAHAEAERLCALLDDAPGIDVTLLAGKAVRRVPLLAALQAHDVVHFAGHSHWDPAAPERSGWRLAEGVLTAGELGKLRPPPLLVFSNSCAAGATAQWVGGPGYEGHAYGIGSAFLLAGVRSYVGTFWVVHDDESVQFATVCYGALAGGASLGEALLGARRAVLADRPDGSLTWASYLLYGDPRFAPLPAGAVPAARGPVPPPTGGAHRFDVAVDARGSAAVDQIAAPTSSLVGRERDLATLVRRLDAARGGERGVVFVTGPPGIGKTALIDAIVARVRAAGDAWVAQGEAVEHYGAGEAYLPVLDAWSRLGRAPDGPTAIAHLRRHAPTWLAQLPGLVDPAEHEGLQRRAQGATRERMLREMAEALEVAAAARLVVLVLEDLHWADHSTLELIAYLAQRRERARLLVVASYRPEEVVEGTHPLRAIAQELQAKGRAEAIALEPLAARDVAAYLRARLGASAVPSALAGTIHRRTEGHPLFLVNVVDFALREGLLAEETGRWTLRGGAERLKSTVPDNLRRMIEHQIEALDEQEQQVLEAASVAGADFSIAAVAAALQVEAEGVDDRCEKLAWRGQFLRAAGVEEWPDGTIAGRYRFAHALYQNVLYDRVAEARRVRLHRRIAERKEAAFGTRVAEVAGELAAHFEAARDAPRAIAHHAKAGDVAVLRHAHREAAEHYERARTLLPRLPDNPDRERRELELLVKLATPLMSTRGYAAPEVGRVFERAHALSRQVKSSPTLFPLLRGLVSFYQVHAEHLRARAVGEELLALVERSDDPIAVVQAHYGHGVTLYDLGEHAAAREHLERALALYDPETHVTHVSVYGGYDPGAACLSWLGWLHWYAGAPDRALASTEEGLRLAKRLGHPFTLTFAGLAIVMVHLFRGETKAARPYLADVATLAEADGFAYHRALATSLEGWANLLSGRPLEAAQLVEAALEGYEATGAGVSRPGLLAVLAHARAFVGRVDEGLRILDDAMAEAERTHQRIHLVGLHRGRATLLLMADPGNAGAAEASLHRALELAREFRSPMLELEAATSLARFWAGRERTAEARALLVPLYETFHEGHQVAPLREARTVLDAL
jgi:CHAT domain-containing protein/tetratricopeptide (TPR) repeat protein